MMNTSESIPAQSDQPSLPAAPKLVGHSSRQWRARRWLLIGLLLLLFISVGAWWFWSPPLTAAEQALVGRWTLPIVPNPPPNAFQQIFWLQPGRKFLFGGRPVGTTSTRFSMSGTWCLEEDHLVLKAERMESLGDSLSQVFGQAPRSGRMDDRIRILGRDDKGLVIEGTGGSRCSLLPLIE